MSRWVGWSRPEGSKRWREVSSGDTYQEARAGLAHLERRGDCAVMVRGSSPARYCDRQKPVSRRSFPGRLAILAILGPAEGLRVVQVMVRANLSQAAAHAHLVALERAGLARRVVGRRGGRGSGVGDVWFRAEGGNGQAP